MQNNLSLNDAGRIVIKIGSALLVEHGRGGLRQSRMREFVQDIAALHRAGKQIVLVSSGAIAAGREHLNLNGQAPLRLEEKQAAAAVGQIHLAHAWHTLFAEFDISIAQLLLSIEDTESRRRHLNARQTIETLLDLNAIPLINENDTIATEEIRFGDNDRLAARVAGMCSADCLVLLSDIDGLYREDPRSNPNAEHIPYIDRLSDDIMNMAGKPPPGYSSGGMITKLQAAKIAMQAGCHMVIAKGENNNILHNLNDRSSPIKRTWFQASTKPATARKSWISGHLNPNGELIIDHGAVKALLGGSSLLAAGIKQVKGSFRRGDLVLVKDEDGHLLAQGLCAYDAASANQLMGKQSHEFEKILGYKGREEIIHRDDLVLLNET